VKRVKATPTQTHLTADERMSNVSSAFEVVQRDSVKGKSVLVVDNVITTGAKAIYVVSVACG
jgi:competence protein ComFC